MAVYIKCCNSLFPFTKLNNHKLFNLFSDEAYCDADTDQNFLILKPSQNMPHLFNEFNNFMSDPNSNTEKSTISIKSKTSKSVKVTDLSPFFA